MEPSLKFAKPLSLVQGKGLALSYTEGFTLIELIISVAIFVIMVTIALIYYNGIQTRARDVRRKADIAIIFKALELYKYEYSEYPESLGSHNRNGWNDSDLNPDDYLPGIEEYTAGILPIDPLNNETYHYSYQKFSPRDYHCLNRPFIVLGVKFEKNPPVGAFSCPDHDFALDFDWALGAYE